MLFVPVLEAQTANKSKSKGLIWGKIEYDGRPWTENISRPNKITEGLQNRHISLWASHGRYYDKGKDSWKWQRPNLFCTTEDLFTQTIVVPYLIPMLENAGAVVFTPRERDWQKNEIIVDNDATSNRNSINYIEVSMSKKWKNAPSKGFASHGGTYTNTENPFTKGTARMAKKTSSTKKASLISYQPDIPEEGRYAVYVSYQSLPKSVEEAHYTVYHKGQQTEFYVNQKMGGGTWVYLGSFDFDKGCNQFNRVVLTNNSKKKGIVTSDAVRFGGGMGNIERGGTTSGLPRCLEGARYYAQWAGAPYNIVSASSGNNDYTDDINVRSLMTNWLAGGSCYAPKTEGKKVPIELSLAVHSDAGIDQHDGIVGSLTICTTDNKGNKSYTSGLSRTASNDFARMLLDNVQEDMAYKFGKWNKRALWDRNYSETRLPEMPSAIIETMSHQNFTDMRYGLDPNFRFAFARSLYKTILKFTAAKHGSSYMVQPLQPDNFNVTFKAKNKVRLSWTPQKDPKEPTSTPSSYNVYIAAGTSGFDNGTNVGTSNYDIELEPNVLYRFRVTACNKGGESFPTEELTAVYQPGAKKTVLIVNGFHRLSAPGVIDTDEQQGFDLEREPGISYGPMAGWSGKQINFDKSKRGKEGPGALGYCGNELAGTFIAGNDFNYVTTHAEAIQTARKYNIVSCSSKALETGKINAANYDCIDLVLGLEKNGSQDLVYYKTFSPTMRNILSDYTTNRNGKLFVSGSYVCSDMTSIEERAFLADILKVSSAGSCGNNGNSYISGLGITFSIYNSINEKHYAVTSTDALAPIEQAYCSMLYSNGSNAGVAYDGKDYRTFTMGFPFECIKEAGIRATLMRGIMAFLLK